MNTRRPETLLVLSVLLLGPAIACGKKGPPLPPLRLVPAPVGEITARRTGPQVSIRFVLPVRNQNGEGPVDLERVEIYAATVAAGTRVPANRDLVSREHLAGSIAVKPPAREGEPPAEKAPDDKRPSAGERAVFVEELTPARLTPITPSAAPAEKQGELPAVAPVESKLPEYPIRVYVIRGFSRAGRPGPPAERVTIPLVDVPLAPAAVAVQPAERAYVLDWLAPVASQGAPPVSFNVYVRGATDSPLNPSPVSQPKFEHAPVRPGEEQCFVVSSVQIVQNVPIESEPSPPACATWIDVYAPAAPTGLQAVASDDGVSLSWNANPEADIGGYLVLRADAGGDTLQPLTREPIRETNYRDTSVQSGVQYAYAIVAVDKSTPANVSQHSARQEVTAR